MSPNEAPGMRPDLAGLPRYVAGRAVTPVDGRAYKLSSNESADVPHPDVVRAMEAAAANGNRYPDAAGGPLVARLSALLGVPASDVVATGGSIVALQQLLQAFAGHGDEVVFAWRSYEAYPIIVQVAGATAVQVPLRDHHHDLPAMAAAVTDRTRVIIVCSPNNPTGTAIADDELRRFLALVPPHVLVVLDEAYREFDTGQDRIDGVDIYREFPNVVTLRTFSKAHALAGVRVGYGVGAAAVMDALRAVALPFTLSSVAQAAGIAAIDVWPWLQPAVAKVSERRDSLRADLMALGYEVPPSQGNFIWMPLGEQAAAFTEAAAAAGVAIRGFAGDGVRITLGEPEGVARLLDVARDFAQRHG